MGKKLANTPRSQIKSAIRQLWLRSRERSAALKRTGNCCEACGVKQSGAKGKEVKLEVHHMNGVPNWKHVEDTIYKHILCHSDQLMPLCKNCHQRQHEIGEL
jgi:predicted HNH restriction endonuclease